MENYGAVLPEFAAAMSFYPGVPPSPGEDSGVMSPMTPMSSYTQGSTPEQAFMTSPEHLLQYNVPSSPYNSDEGVVMHTTSKLAHHCDYWTSVII